MNSRRRASPFFAHSLVLLFIPAVILLLALPIRTSRTLWKHYRILTVSPAETEAEVVSRLGAVGASKIVTQANTSLPRGNSLSPVQPFIDEVNRQRSNWFVHRESNTRFFFLPDEPDLENRVQAALSSLPVTWYLENAGAFYRYFFIPIVLLLVAGLALQKNRGMALITAIPSFLLVYAWNSPSGMLSSAILLVTVIIVSDLLYTGPYLITRTQLLRRITGNLRLLLPLILPMLFALASGSRAFLLFISALTCSVSLLVLYHVPGLRFLRSGKGSTRRLHDVLQIVPMHPETLYRRGFFRKNLFLILTATLAVSTAGTGLFFVTVRGESPFTGNGRLYLPCPSGYTEQTGFSAGTFEEFIRLDRNDSLPDLADFLAVQWKITVFPWKDYRDRLEPPVIGEQMVVQNYVFDEKQGRLAAQTRVVAVFDQEFIGETLSEKATPLEQMLIDQGRFVSGRITGHPE
mgnify:FL=1